MWAQLPSLNKALAGLADRTQGEACGLISATVTLCACALQPTHYRVKQRRWESSPEKLTDEVVQQAGKDAHAVGATRKSSEFSPAVTLTSVEALANKLFDLRDYRGKKNIVS